MVNSADFAKRLEKVLEYYGLSATAFAEEINFNRSTISHIFSGRNKPSLELVMKILQKFPEVKLNWLMNGKGTFPATETKTKINEASISPSPNLFSDKENPESNSINKISEASEKIERIVIFYKDGSFKVYEN